MTVQNPPRETPALAVMGNPTQSREIPKADSPPGAGNRLRATIAKRASWCEALQFAKAV